MATQKFKYPRINLAENVQKLLDQNWLDNLEKLIPTHKTY